MRPRVAIIDIDASDAGTITADAGGYVDIDAGSGGIEVVVATAGTDVYIDSAGDVGSVDATASDDIWHFCVVCRHY